MRTLTLKTCREIIEATVEEMARATGINQKSIYSWENGTTYPTAEQTSKALLFFKNNGLDVSINYINFITEQAIS